VAGDVTPIGIAVVEQGGCYLVGRRGPDRPLAGLSEFPGGKCRPNESPRDCALRECREETGLEVTATAELCRTTHRYSHGTVELHFWLCRPADETAVDNESGFDWVPADQLAKQRFPDGNARVLEILAQRR